MGRMQPTEETGGPPAEPAATEVVTRPEPGLARGAWEAPAWAFWVVLVLAVTTSALYLLKRLGLLRFRRKAS
jgi:hypothetical protein